MEGLVDAFEAVEKVAETEALEIAGDDVETAAEVVEVVGVEIAGNAVGAAAEVVEVVEAGVGVVVVAAAAVCEATAALKWLPALRLLWKRVGTEIQLALGGIE